MTEKMQDAGIFTLVGDQVQALADEVGAALVNCAATGGESCLNRDIAIAGLSAAEWEAYFRLSFGAESAPDGGVVLGDFMFKDTARHRQVDGEPAVTVNEAEVKMYLTAAFGPDITLETIGQKAEGGVVTFTGLPEGDLKVVEAQDAWHEADAGGGRPIEIRYRLGSEEAMDGPLMDLSLTVTENPESPYGCYVTAFCVRKTAE